MRELFKILLSIVLALISIALFLSFAALIVELHSYLNNETNDFTFALGIVWVIVWIGFLMFALAGSILWRLYLLAFKSWSCSSMRKHTYSSLLSALTCTSIFALTQLNGGIYEVTKAYFLLVFVLPVVYVSLFFYRKLYAENKT